MIRIESFDSNPEITIGTAAFKAALDIDQTAHHQLCHHPINCLSSLFDCWWNVSYDSSLFMPKETKKRNRGSLFRLNPSKWDRSRVVGRFQIFFCSFAGHSFIPSRHGTSYLRIRHGLFSLPKPGHLLGSLGLFCWPYRLNADLLLLFVCPMLPFDVRKPEK